MLVNGEQAIGLVYDLLFEKKWLVEKAKKLPLDPLSEKEAIMFLATLDQQSETTWLQLTPNQRSTANGLIMDFIAKCLTTSREWNVPDDLSPPEQAIHIFKQEIERSHFSLLILN